jgi:hypothetical protein
MTYGGSISGDNIYGGATTLAPAHRYRGQTIAIYRQTMLFDWCLEWVCRAISHVRGSQVVRRGVLGDAQRAFQSGYGLLMRV